MLKRFIIGTTTLVVLFTIGTMSAYWFFSTFEPTPLKPQPKDYVHRTVTVDKLRM